MHDKLREIHKQRIDNQVAERKRLDQIKNLEMKQKQLEKASKNAEKMFVGKKFKYRSEKETL